jgi:hypothetical protein
MGTRRSIGLFASEPIGACHPLGFSSVVRQWLCLFVAALDCDNGRSATFDSQGLKNLMARLKSEEIHAINIEIPLSENHPDSGA